MFILAIKLLILSLPPLIFCMINFDLSVLDEDVHERDKWRYRIRISLSITFIFFTLSILAY